MDGGEFEDLWPHRCAVAEDVFDEAPRDPVEDAVLVVLAAAVAPAALGDSPEANDGGQVEKDHGVCGGEADRKGAGVVAFDQPPVALHEPLLRGSELVALHWIPVLVVEDRIKVSYGQVQQRAEALANRGLSATAASNNDNAPHLLLAHRRRSHFTLR